MIQQRQKFSRGGRSAPCRLGWALCTLPPAAAGAVGDQGGYSPNSENFDVNTFYPKTQLSWLARPGRLKLHVMSNFG